jgi:hypothetical protein
MVSFKNQDRDPRGLFYVHFGGVFGFPVQIAAKFGQIKITSS